MTLHCWFGRHQATVLQPHQARLSLKCVDCGYESAGWDLTDAPLKTIASISTQARDARASLRCSIAAANARSYRRLA